MIETLANQEDGMSSMELADAIHVNRMTITKYLNILSAIGLIKKKKIGSINIWTRESGVDGIEFPLNYIHIQQKFLTALLGYNKRECSKILLNIIYSDTEILKIFKEIMIPSLNTINELYTRGRLGKTELIYLNHLLFDLSTVIEIHYKPIEYNKNIHNIFIAGNEDQILYSKMLSLVSEVSNCDTIYLGNIGSISTLFLILIYKGILLRFGYIRKERKLFFYFVQMRVR